MTDSQFSHLNAQQLAEAERTVAQKLVLDNWAMLLVASWVIFAVGLFLPHGGPVKGWHVLTFQSASQGLQLGIAEIVCVVLGFAGIIVCGGATLVTKRTVFAYLGWLLVGMALLSSLLGLWMRIQDHENSGAPSIGAGFALEVLAIILAVISLTVLVLKRTDAQKELAKLRATYENLDEVGHAQREAASYKQTTVNPLLIDDRRQQAKRKHNNT